MPDDEDFYVPPGFDLDGGWSQGDGKSISDIAAEYGWTDWRDIVMFDGGYDETDVRPGVHLSAESAIQEAYERGFLDFAHIIYDDEDEVWYLVVDGDSGDGT